MNENDGATRWSKTFWDRFGRLDTIPACDSMTVRTSPWRACARVKTNSGRRACPFNADNSRQDQDQNARQIHQIAAVATQMRHRLRLAAAVCGEKHLLKGWGEERSTERVLDVVSVVKMKKKIARRHKHCALAVVTRSQKFSPRHRPPSRGRRTAKI